jgi:hypothetical protein
LNGGKPKLFSTRSMPKGITRYVIRGLIPNTKYQFDLVTTTPNSTVSSVISLSGAPTPVNNLAASWVSGGIFITWSPPKDTSDSLIGIIVAGDDGSQKELAVSSATGGIKVNINNLKAKYTISALVRNASGTSDIRQIFLNGGLPGAPKIVVKSESSGSADITWSVSGEQASQFFITISSKGNSRHGSVINIAGSARAATIDNLTPGKVYAFTVTGRNARGNGAPSTSVTVSISDALETPKNVEAVSSDSSVSLTWDAIENVLYKFRVGYRSGVLAGWAYLPSTSNNYAVISNLENGNRYNFIVELISPDGRKSTSQIVSSTPYAAASEGNAAAPAAPATTNITGFTVTARPSSVLVNWDEEKGQKYIQYRERGTSIWLSKSVLDSSNRIDGLINGITYQFRVALPEGTIISGIKEVTPLDFSTPVRSLLATPGHSEIVLTWEEPLDNGGTKPIWYIISWRSSAGIGEKTCSPDCKRFVATGLRNGIIYNFTIFLVTEFGDGQISTISATPSS